MLDSGAMEPDEELNEDQLRELEELTKFIDAHGGRLGAYREPSPPESEGGASTDQDGAAPSS